MSEEQKTPFWSSLAGLITAIAALVSAVGGLIALLHGTGTHIDVTPTSSRPAAASVAATPPVSDPVPPPARTQVPSSEPSPTLSEDATYQLYMYQGARTKNGLNLRLRKVNNDRYTADFSSPAEVGYTWSGELQRTQNNWVVTISTYTEGNPPWAGSSEEMPGGRFNPSGAL